MFCHTVLNLENLFRHVEYRYAILYPFKNKQKPNTLTATAARRERTELARIQEVERLTNLTMYLKQKNER